MTETEKTLHLADGQTVLTIRHLTLHDAQRIDTYTRDFSDHPEHLVQSGPNLLAHAVTKVHRKGRDLAYNPDERCAFVRGMTFQDFDACFKVAVEFWNTGLAPDKQLPDHLASSFSSGEISN